ncbi:hypothetical protein F442_14732 [Phytophthora nicotianae P10297]|uniref:Uncharacterized protein n=2 Tax=Phytophthora nicotianae TaxID=4792 RepID=W2YR03_PHYNI|nr:hypothetical protein F444_14883 [Phytophthora nicotianae P1976]ETP37460.1 hypothetical protein F442_14732 [Phytophthora nicotianae P10297]
MMQLGRITKCKISKGLTDIFVSIFTVVATPQGTSEGRFAPMLS